MPHVVTKNCYDCRYTDCVNVCPVECFYADDKMLYIDPEECIDCEACVTECPVEAIYLDVNVPQDMQEFIATNAERSAYLKDNDGHIDDREKALKGPECITTRKEKAAKEKAEREAAEKLAQQPATTPTETPTQPVEGPSSPQRGPDAQ